jgi:hypothetical protein
VRHIGYSGPNPALDAFWRWRNRIQDHQDGEPGVVWDIETPTLDPGGPTLCVGWQRGSVGQVHWGNMLETAGPFLDQLTPGQLLVAHNMKFEAGSLRTRGLDPYSFVWWDTMLGEWVLLANNPHGASIGLDESAQRYGREAKDPEVDRLIKSGRVLEVPQDKLIARNRKDVEDTAYIFQRQLERMTEAQIRLTIARSMEALELAHIEPRGMGLDREAVAREIARNAAEIAEHETALREITKGANPRSVNEMAPVLYGIWPGNVEEDDKYEWTHGCGCLDLAGSPLRRKAGKRLCPACGAADVRGKPLVESLGFKEPKDSRNKGSKAWPDGKPSISKEVMEQLASRARTERQRTWAKHYMALCEAISERDKNLRYFGEVCEKGDGVVYAELWQGVTATHRLSCRGKADPRYRYGCQLQNVPRHLKGLLVPKHPDYLAASVDQSQAEFRGAIFLTDDLQGREDIANPAFDAHIQTLTVMLNGTHTDELYSSLFTRYKAGDKEVAFQRADNQLCKGHTFAPLFGGAGESERERTYYKWFKVHYSGVTSVQNAWDDEVQLTGRYTAPTGMVFTWDRKFTTDFKGRSRMVNHLGRSLYSIVRNLPIQYFATGELALVSTLCLLYEIRRLRLRYECVMLIHDDTSGEVHKEDAQAFHTACGSAYGSQTHEFLRSVYDINYDVELAAESKVGVRFGSGSKQEHSYNFPFTDEDLLQMKISAKSSSPRTPSVKEGTHIALLAALVDLGVQPGSAKYPKPKRKVFLGFEFPNVQVTYPGKDGKPDETAPARASRWMSLSMHEKSSFRKFVEMLRGKKFATDAEASSFDVKELLGVATMAAVTHKVVGDNTYVEVGTCTPLLEGMVCSSKLSKPALYFDTDAYDLDVFKTLPQFLQEAINARQVGSKPQSNAPLALSGGLPEMGTDNGGNDEDIPF